MNILILKARTFIYSTVLSPGTIAASLASLDYLGNNCEILEELWGNIRLLKTGLTDLGYKLVPSQSAIIPIMIGNERDPMELSTGLLEDILKENHNEIAALIIEPLVLVEPERCSLVNMKM
ncbi:aminotransferase class I/II-fold pyridoxal phosphate-dependent enzyme [Selenihalanaerobacter shriftii]|uniref:Aminotransferase class I and II n=1 Tax=Selenihalanaerobacter shriftii TaxID=142842 RepID=A0A1T4JQT1_9FIRM|nr:aminotransferase class I/II-fold pyridoxal phosphate-dependent enzyme [Selenihalanaerobacter shriftii]SJZ32513.1 Aminotransferase class I and II [Selenihalanaerobacter shriftii]